MLTVTQWLNWSSTYYLLTVLARPIAEETGWSLAEVVAGLSLGLIVAGLASPAVGRAIERRGGRPILALGSAVLAGGLLGIGLSHGAVGYFVAWTVSGIGMAASLYDAAFATLGKLYGLRARPMISNLMTIMAFAAALFWPFTALLTETLGWRGACLCYAAMHLLIGLPLHLFLLPRTGSAPAAIASTPCGAAAPDTAPAGSQHRGAPLVWLVATNITLQVAIGSVLAVNLLSLLEGLGMTYAAAVGLGSVIWLSQAGGRLIDAVAGSWIRPVAEGVAASILVLLGVGLILVAAPPAIAIGIVLFGIGHGVRGILKGTLPLVLFGAEGYATLIGRLGLPTLIAQATGPALGAVALGQWGAVPLLAALAVLAASNLGLAYALWVVAPKAR